MASNADDKVKMKVFLIEEDDLEFDDFITLFVETFTPADIELNDDNLCSVLRRFEASGIDLNNCDHFGATSLHWMAQHGLPKAVDFLLEKNVDATIVDRDGDTPLHYFLNGQAYRRGGEMDWGIFKKLINAGVDLAKEDKGGFTPLQLLFAGPIKISAEEFHELVEFLGKKSQDLLKLFVCPSSSEEAEAKAKNEAVPLLLVCQMIDIKDKTLALLSNAGVDLDFTTENGFRPLAAAIVGKRSVSFVRRLIKRGADVQKLDANGMSLL